ncbi:MAG: hypothetical protein K9J30_04660 [Bacteroidales bacterium]|nr:hypothetical protein [Bacteroidales bacterium]
MNRKNYIITLLLFGIVTLLEGQVMFRNEMLNQLDFYNRNGYSEKVLLYPDKDLYFAGDEMKFGIRLTEGKCHLPEALSSIVYVELLDFRNQPFAQKKFRINNSSGSGILKLPLTLASGNYMLRAYTSWMKNFSPLHYFHLPLTIINPEKPYPSIASSETRIAHIDFSPEGGNLVQGVENHLAVRYTNQYHQKFTDECSIISLNGDTVCNVSLDKNGIGIFIIKPMPGTTYGILHQDSLYLLPAAHGNKISMHTEDAGHARNISIFSGYDRPKMEEIYLLLHQNGDPLIFEKLDLNDHRTEYSIEDKELPPGFSEVVLFSKEFEYLSSACLFGGGNQPDELHVSISDSIVTARSTLSLQIKTEPGARISASVFLPAFTDSISNQPTSAFYKHWQGNIYPDPEKTKAEMIFRGRDMGSYQTITRIKTIEFPPEIRNDLISGAVLNGNKNPENNSNLYISRLGRNCDVQSVDFDKKGSFIYSPLESDFPEQLIFSGENPEQLNILIRPEFSEDFAGINFPSFHPEKYKNKDINKLLVASQLRNIYRPGKNHVEQSNGSVKFYGRPDESVHISDYIKLPVMEEFFRELVTYCIFTREEGRLKLNVLGKHNNRIIGPDPMILVDGIPVQDTKTILDLDPETIKSIHVKACRYIYGNTIMDGIVDIESNDGNASVLDLEDRIASFIYEPAENISSIDIGEYNSTTSHASLADQRTVICWQPNLVADSHGNVYLNFTPSDVEGEYVIVINALTKNGTAEKYTGKLIVK